MNRITHGADKERGRCNLSTWPIFLLGRSRRMGAASPAFCAKT